MEDGGMTELESYCVNWCSDVDIRVVVLCCLEATLVSPA